MIVLLLSIGALIAEAGPTEGSSIREVISEHVERYPEFEIQDLYKLLHQAAFGNRHAAGHGTEAHVWIADEPDPEPVNPAPPTFEPITPDGRLVRVHLQPFVASGGDQDLLHAAFQRTAHEFGGSTGRLERYWKSALQMAEVGDLRFPAAEMGDFFASMKEQDYPPVHHSEGYRDLYRPSYRVVLREHLPPE